MVKIQGHQDTNKIVIWMMFWISRLRLVLLWFDGKNYNPVPYWFGGKKISAIWRENKLKSRWRNMFTNVQIFDDLERNKFFFASVKCCVKL